MYRERRHDEDPGYLAERLMEELLGTMGQNRDSTESLREPPHNVFEYDEAVVAIVELQGCEGCVLDIHSTGNAIIIGKTPGYEKGEAGKLLPLRITMPCPIREGPCDYTCTNGVVEIYACRRKNKDIEDDITYGSEVHE